MMIGNRVRGEEPGVEGLRGGKVERPGGESNNGPRHQVVP